MPAAAELVDIAFKRHADELRASWQARLIAGALTSHNGIVRPNSGFCAVILSVIAHNYDEALPVLLRVVFPNYVGIGNPFLTSAAKIAKSGHIMADFVDTSGILRQRQSFFVNERDMERKFRELADKAKLTDTERTELFTALKNWVVCDFRLDPTMDSRDPDAKRLVH